VLNKPTTRRCSSVRCQPVGDEVTLAGTIEWLSEIIAFPAAPRFRADAIDQSIGSGKKTRRRYWHWIESERFARCRCLFDRDKRPVFAGVSQYVVADVLKNFSRRSAKDRQSVITEYAHHARASRT